ncbi:MAG: RNA-binding transcriptional accessory protein [Firmicutes bacterium]|nr:RNA-binding transcriptional accessory protein [Bacillota bacterium]
MLSFAEQIASALSLKAEQVQAVIDLLNEGNTIPFIARYRKEAHGSLDDQTIRQIADKLESIRNLEARREEIRNLIEKAGVMNDEIKAAIDAAATLSSLEDIYRPYRPKRRTRASAAKEKGLEPLADEILAQHRKSPEPAVLAEAYVDAEKGVNNVEEAVAGAMDIIAEKISDDADMRKELRDEMTENGILTSEGTTEETSVYSQYYDFRQSVKTISGYRVLAINRGEKEKFLKVAITSDPVRAQRILYKKYVRKNNSLCCGTVSAAADDAYTRLIQPALEREIRSDLTDKASEAAIKVFGMNLRELLLAPPVKGKVTVGLDPGYRTGCKTAVVSATGQVLATTVLYLTHGEARAEQSAAELMRLIRKYHVELIAIGNGTASKETEIFTSNLLKREKLTGTVHYMVVSEAGASVYSASELAASEYPELDLTLRSAVSIAHRLQDPLAELVKIDPKAIGIGQYQHDMPPKRLSDTLDGVVEDCVNSVGVDLNTASPSLLKNVAGITPAIAKNIVAYREENGAFTSRAELKKVPKLGPKAYEQCAGFLRVPESSNVLDNTAVHPESYPAAAGLLEFCGYDPKHLQAKGYSDLRERLASAGGEKKAAESMGIGVPTLHDIVEELLKPGRDPRDEIPVHEIHSDILDIKDLKPGMEFTGTVRNIVDFGAFVDIGVHQDGLVHITQISRQFVRHPSDVLHVGQIVKVWVLTVDVDRGRIGLTMKGPLQ